MRVPSHQINAEEPMSVINWRQCFNSRGHCTVNNRSWALEILDNEAHSIETQNLMTGKEFLKQIDRYYLNNKNCELVSIMLEGYKSNLGLEHKNIRQGDVKLNKRQFKKLFKLYKVMVLWNEIEAKNE